MLINHKYSLVLAVLLLVIIGSCNFVNALDYYVSNSGSDSFNGLSTGTPWETVAKVNAASPAAGSNISFDSGDIWREQLTIPTSGSVGSPITYTSYGTGDTPVISGFDIITTWTDSGSDVWYSAVAVTPTVILFDDTNVGTIDITPDTETEWYYDGLIPGKLYVYSEQDPDNSTTYAATVEATQRAYALLTGTEDYITITNLIFEGGINNSMRVNTSHNSILDNIIARYSVDCIDMSSGQGGVIKNSTCYSCISDGMLIQSKVTGTVLVFNNTVYDTYGGGIFLYSIQSGRVYNNILYDGDKGIKIQHSNNCILERNQIYNNNDGIFISGADLDGHKISYNIIYNNSDEGIETVTVNDGTLDIFNNVIYNNTDKGALILNSNTTIVNNIIRDNLVEIWLTAHGGTNFVGSNNIYKDGVGVYKINAGSYSTYAAWAAVSGDTNSLTSDPLFVNASGNVFNLQEKSPAIDAGYNLGEDYEIGPDNRDLTFPYDTINQNRYGDWEIGAFVYPKKSKGSGISKTIESEFFELF